MTDAPNSTNHEADQYDQLSTSSGSSSKDSHASDSSRSVVSVNTIQEMTTNQRSKVRSSAESKKTYQKNEKSKMKLDGKRLTNESLRSKESKASNKSKTRIGSKESVQAKMSKTSTTSKTKTKKKKTPKSARRNSSNSIDSTLSTRHSLLFPRLSRTSLNSRRDTRSTASSINSATVEQERDKNILRRAKKSGKGSEDLNAKKKSKKDYIFDSNENSLDNSDISDESEEVTEIEEIQKRNSMLRVFGELPDINELSETSWVEAKTDEDENTGRFVSPTSRSSDILLDVDTARPSTEVEQPSSMEELASETSVHGIPRASGSLMSWTSSIESTDDELFEVRSVAVTEHEDAESLLQKMTSIVIRGSHGDLTATSQMDAHSLRLAAIGACEHFLHELLNRVVTYCETHSVQLTRLLDKEKMLKALIPMIEAITEESLFKEKLEQLTTEHFLRKKRFAFIKTPKTFDALNYQRYNNALIELDRHLELLKGTYNKAQKQTHILREELQAAHIYSEQKIFDYDQFVRQTLLSNDSFIHLKNMVENVLKSMSRFRDDLSEMRMDLLNTQHRFADIQMKSEALEDLGDGLKMREYLTKQADTQMLCNKIADRNAELNRLKMKITYDINALAHLKGKEHMCRRTCNRSKAKLKLCEEWKRHYRELIYQGKLKHNRFLKELNKIKTAGSLFHYPILMRDYDRTEVTLRLKRKSVEKLRQDHKRLTNRIRQAENILEALKRKSITTRVSVVYRKPSMPAALTISQIKLKK